MYAADGRNAAIVAVPWKGVCEVFWILLAGYSIIFGVLAAVVCRAQWKRYYVWAKVAASVSFLVVLSVAAYRGENVHSYYRMLPAFLCCFFGDILMAEYNLSRRRIYFITGLLVFLAGHLFFVRWLCTLQPLTAVDFVFPVAAVVLTFGLTSVKSVHTGKLKPAILIYSFFVALFFTKGVHLAAVQTSVSNSLIAAGSTLFLMSDISILFLYFKKTKGCLVHLFNLVTYYYGMFLLASHLMFLYYH